MDYKRQIGAYLDKEKEVMNHLNLDDINTVINVLENARLSGRHIFICGNGGSAATASHYCGDFTKGVSENLKVKYKAECLSDSITTMMAVANDISYQEIFRYPLRNKMEKGDILIGISGSGNSENVIRAIEYAREIGGTSIAITGYDGGRMLQMADYHIHVNIHDMQIAEDIHMMLDHLMMYVLTHRSE